MSDERITGFMKKYGAVRAKPNGDMPDDFLLEAIRINREMIQSGVDQVGHRLSQTSLMGCELTLKNLEAEAKKRGLP